MVSTTSKSCLILLSGLVMMYVPACIEAAAVDGDSPLNSATKKLMRNKDKKRNKDKDLAIDSLVQQHQQPKEASIQLLMRSNRKGKQTGVTIDPQALLNAGPRASDSKSTGQQYRQRKSREHTREEDKGKDAVSATQDSVLEQGHVADEDSDNEENDNDTAALSEEEEEAVDADEEADDEDPFKKALSLVTNTDTEGADEQSASHMRMLDAVENRVSEANDDEAEAEKAQHEAEGKKRLGKGIGKSRLKRAAHLKDPFHKGAGDKKGNDCRWRKNGCSRDMPGGKWVGKTRYNCCREYSCRRRFIPKNDKKFDFGGAWCDDERFIRRRSMMGINDRRRVNCPTREELTEIDCSKKRQKTTNT